MSSKLTNYLRTYRKRADLTQQEVAFLFGCSFGTKVSRYEHFIREPGIRAAFACEVIFRAKLRDLFAGIYEQVERDVGKRARILLRNLSDEGNISERKLASLTAIVEALDDLRWESTTDA